MEAWKIPSNHGWNMTSIRLRSPVKVERRNCLLVEVIFTGRFYDRAKLIRRDCSSHKKEYSLILPQVLIKERALRRLYDPLRHWLKTPINLLNQTPLNDQQFKLEFDSAGGYNSQTDHPVCRIVYRCNALAGESAYLIDQSCVQIFVDDLKRYFDSKARA